VCVCASSRAQPLFSPIAPAVNQTSSSTAISLPSVRLSPSDSPREREKGERGKEVGREDSPGSPLASFLIVRILEEKE